MKFNPMEGKLMEYKITVQPVGGRRAYAIGKVQFPNVIRRPEYSDAVLGAAQLLPKMVWDIARISTREYMSRQLKKGGVGLEIGVDYGDGIALWLQSEPRLVVGVDPWVTGEDGWYSQPQAEMDARCRGVQERFASDGRVAIRRTTSDEYFVGQPGPFDWIHIDGDHEEEPTYRDLTNAWKCLSAGGILMLDDTHCGGWKEKIGRALARFVADVGAENMRGPFVAHSDPWAVVKL